MGFTVGAAQCLVAPPYAFAGIVMYAAGYLGDKYHVRGPIILFNMLLCLIGLPLMGFHKNAAVRYFGVFLTTAGANSNVPATMSYQANNIRGQWKRAFCSATLVGMGGVGGIAGGLVFREQGMSFRQGTNCCGMLTGLQTSRTTTRAYTPALLRRCLTLSLCFLLPSCRGGRTSARTAARLSWNTTT
jgi:MFS family permease